MNVLILKLNATGDVVRTTTLLRRSRATSPGLSQRSIVCCSTACCPELRCFTWEERELARDRQYDLVINLEDEPRGGNVSAEVRHSERFGAYLSMATTRLSTQTIHAGGSILSLISMHGRKRADELKLQNRRHVPGAHLRRVGAAIRRGAVPVLAAARQRPRRGRRDRGGRRARLADEELGLLRRAQACARGNWFAVNLLPRRPTLLEHMGDVKNHRCLVSGDSLPMHLALGTRTPCVTLFNCTSPWEIYDYGIQTKIISPLLDRFFYQRGHDRAATSAIKLEEVYDAVAKRLYACADSHLRSRRRDSATDPHVLRIVYGHGLPGCTAELPRCRVALRPAVATNLMPSAIRRR